VLCRGQALLRTTYAALYAALGGPSSLYGQGDGFSTFNVPDFQGKTAVGMDASQTEFDTLAKTGGEKTHLLTTPEMPSHSHTGTAAAAGSHAHSTTTWGFAYGTTSGSVAVTRHSSSGAQYSYNMGSDTEANHTHSVSTTAQGGGTPHQNMPPYLTLNYIIKT
jgi:microcystin-dependent protein